MDVAFFFAVVERDAGAEVVGEEVFHTLNGGSGFVLHGCLSLARLCAAFFQVLLGGELFSDSDGEGFANDLVG